jgi:uncharacterized small protein (DUF1192 family)
MCGRMGDSPSPLPQYHHDTRKRGHKREEDGMSQVSDERVEELLEKEMKLEAEIERLQADNAWLRNIIANAVAAQDWSKARATLEPTPGRKVSGKGKRASKPKQAIPVEAVAEIERLRSQVEYWSEYQSESWLAMKADNERLRAALQIVADSPQGCDCLPSSGCKRAQVFEVVRLALEFHQRH